MAVAVGAFLVALHGSLQHEIIHGHPTRWQRVNTCLASLPLGLWIPFELYKKSHLAHHRSDLTTPNADPESFFVTWQTWQQLNPLARAIYWVNTTLLGRMLIGPTIVIVRFLTDEIARFLRGDFRHARAWLKHLVASAGLIYWAVVVCDIPFMQYILIFVYPGLSLTLLRSFAEHMQHPDPDRRTTIVESRVLGAVFLWNNLHVLHHRFPGLPWYRYWAVYHQRQAELVHESRTRFHDYLEVFIRFGLKPIAHPAGRPVGQVVHDRLTSVFPHHPGTAH